MTTPRHEFYETNEKLTLSIFDRGADPAQISVSFEPRAFKYENGDKLLVLQPLKGEIDPEKSDFSVGKVKVEVRFVKRVPVRWSELVGEEPDMLSTINPGASSSTPSTSSTTGPKPAKNWDSITTNILSSEKEKSISEDPNAGGDAAVNDLFRKIFADADEDSRRAMMKSFVESGGTALSTSWDDVKKGPVEVKPPQGSEYKQWG